MSTQGKEWMPTKTPTKSCELEDGPQEDNYPIQMPWTRQLDELEGDLQDQKKSIITYPIICQEGGFYKEDKEGDALNRISGKWNVIPVIKKDTSVATVLSIVGTSPEVKDKKPSSMIE